MANTDQPSLTNDINSSWKQLIVVVGLFALVGILVGIAATSELLEAAQRWILIVFIIVFSTVGAGISVWLVLRQARQYAVGAGNRGFGWKPSSTDSQRRKLDDNLRDIINALKVSDVQIDDLFSAYIVAEDLALRQVQQEAKENLLRHQSIGGTDFDAILFKRDVVTCIEIAFLVAPDVAQAKINEMLNKVAAAEAAFNRSGKTANLRLLLILITQLDTAGEEQLRSSLVKKFSATAVDVDIRLFDFEGLQKVYAP